MSVRKNAHAEKCPTAKMSVRKNGREQKCSCGKMSDRKNEKPENPKTLMRKNGGAEYVLPIGCKRLPGALDAPDRVHG